MPRVIPIPTLATMKTEAPTTVRAKGRKSERRTAPRTPEGQQTLDFVSTAAPAGRTLRTSVEAVIYCDAPVASAEHRAMAAALDASMVLIAVGVFLAIFALSGGDILLNRHTMPYLIGVVATLAVFYHLLWALGNGDTPGMRWTQLRLLNFDGRRPSRSQRARRIAAGCLSLLAAGIGLLWALVDEEKLGWQDHISKTFPTPQR